MTTFTSDDREEAYKKIVEAAPNQPGYEDAVPIPPVDRTSKELTDEEIEEIGKQYLSAHAQFIGAGECHYEGEIEFARAILRKASEK